MSKNDFMKQPKTHNHVRLTRPRCPTCGAQTEGLLNGLGLLTNGGRQIWACVFPCNKIVTAPEPNAPGQFAIELKNDQPDGTELWGAYESEALAREVATAFIANDSTWRVVPATAGMEFSGRPM